MKKFLKITGGIVIFLFILILVFPVLFKGKIEKVVKEQINNSVNAKVDYQDFTLSLLKNFPNVSMGIEGLSISGKDQFKQDTLLHLGAFNTKIGLLGAISGRLDVHSVVLSNLTVNALVMPDSSANWDIAVPSETTEVEGNSDESSDFEVVLESFVINNANINYTDHTMALQSAIKGFNLDMSGDLSASKTNLQIASSIDQVNVVYDEVNYLKGLAIGLNAGIGADLDNNIFTFLENELTLNRMALTMDGSVAIKDEAYDLDLKLGSTNTDFKSLLALVPEQYLKDFEGLKADGTMNLNAVVKGLYTNEDNLPAFTIDLGVDEGRIQYPDLPESIDHINVGLTVNNPGGGADLTITKLDEFHFEIADNPFDASFKIMSPVSNLSFEGLALGRIDLQSLSNAIPMDSFDIRGLIETDFSIKGNYDMIEKEAYEQIDAQGDVMLSNFLYKSNEIPQGVFIKHSNMTINPRSIKLESFDCLIGRSDFKLDGAIENYLAYVLKDGVLKGKLNHYSKRIDTNEFMMMASEGEETEDNDEEMTLVEVPKNIDFTFKSQIEQLIYDKLNVQRANGKITVRDGAVQLNGLKMKLLDGSMKMTGQYNTANLNKPFVDFDIEGDKLDLNMAANSFSVVDSLLPLAKNTIGKVSPKFKYYSVLDNKSMPVMASVNGGGWLRSKSVEVSSSKIQNTLASTLNNDSYKKMRAEDLNINFIIDKGNVIVKPFKTKVGGKMVEVQGVQGLDKTVDYKIIMPVSRKEVAKMAGLMGFNLPTSGDDLIVDVLVKGTVDEPQLSFGLDKARKQVEKDLKKEGENLFKNLLKGF